MNYFEQISLVVISPSLMANKDYAYALEDLMTSQLRIVAIKLLQLNKADIDLMFGKKVNIKLNLIEYELMKSESLVIVIEGQQAIKHVSESIGTFKL